MITIAHAKPGDAPAMAALLEEMDRFYGAADTEPLDERVKQINDAVFASPVAAYVLLAWHRADLAGIAAYSFLWPAAGLTRSLYLKELYVGERYRRQGTGKALMDALFEVAAKTRCSRVEWTTDTGNPGAMRFYEMLGVPPRPSKVFYRVEDTGAGLQTGQPPGRTWNATGQAQ